MIMRSILTVSISLLSLSLCAQDTVPENSGTLKVKAGEQKVKQDQETRFGNKIRYQIMGLATPEVTLEGKTSGKITVAEIKDAKALKIDIDTTQEVSFKIVSFHFTFRAKDADMVKISGKGPGLTTEMQQVLRGCKAGDYLFIDAIILTAGGKDERHVKGLAFEII